MGVLLSTIRSALNLLLPFTSPNTPLIQDLLHTAILFGTFYYGPQIAEYYNTHHAPAPPPRPTDDAQHTNQNNGSAEDLPLDENFVLQPESDGEEVDPPPTAPTPPPGLPLPNDAAVAAWQDNNQANDAFAGPANPDRPRATPANRPIGTKKAKSLARRDQRRAYHEFHRSQAEQRRQAEAEGREEREALLAAEKARRAEVEREIAEKKRAEVERRKDEERREAEEERERRERVVERVRGEVMRKGVVDLVDVAWEEGKDRLWIDRLVRASGMVAQMEKDGGRVLITGNGWLARLDAQFMQKAYAGAVAFGEAKDGRVSFDEFGAILEKAVRVRAAAA
ncbi:hypothetical protein K458DRAFT_443371 [Lentithecium fluviatile CBS 122367]|uniref:Uncharacterized protein n=1 Tax=Lentithecium fluviatile CBS 122367 TaxID=1168545 RepID=A0A6G1J024_9PLEO|nr:hypothetical protein K458DRAFT_443371 [Lentithecium fluviatile CBS 122367]